MALIVRLRGQASARHMNDVYCGNGGKRVVWSGGVIWWCGLVVWSGGVVWWCGLVVVVWNSGLAMNFDYGVGSFGYKAASSPYF
jgi:hypothetical protein